MTASFVERLPHVASGCTRTLPRETRTVHNTAAQVSSDGGIEVKLETFSGRRRSGFESDQRPVTLRDRARHARSLARAGV